MYIAVEEIDLLTITHVSYTNKCDGDSSHITLIHGYFFY